VAAKRGKIEIHQGNETVRKISVAALARAGFELVDDGVLGDVLILDVSSGLPNLEDRALSYAEKDLPVLYCGVRNDREAYQDMPWVDRPFAQNTLVAACMRLIQGGAILPTFGTEDDPITRELRFEEAIQLEEQLGLEAGALGGDVPAMEIEDNDDDVLNLDEHGSSIIAVEELSSLVAGGKLIGLVNKRAIDAEEIVQDRAESSAILMVRTPTFNQTMPDTPMALASEGVDAATLTTPSIVPPPPDDGDGSSSHAELSVQVKSVARMLAESWNRIGGSARLEDRADHIERVLHAMIQQGVRGAQSELRRIPPKTGFAGDLETLGVIDLLRTIRERRLRGRLELSLVEGAYVLYLDGGEIEDIESLSGSGDLMLLDTLRGLGFLDDSTHSELSQGYATGAYLEPVELKLRRENLLTEENLREGRSRRLRNTFGYLCGVRRGEFAFLPVRSGDGLPWPVRGLRLSVDALLLEILREGNLDTGDSQATARTRLVLDAARTSSMNPSMLTPEEVAVLRYFRDGETVGNVLEELSLVEVDKIVHRLKALELLKRSNPFIHTPEHQPGATVVSAVSDSISKHERSSERPNDQTTHLKESFAIGPDDDSFDDVEDAATDIVRGDE